MKNILTYEEFLNESKNEIIFSVDDEKLDNILHAKFGRQLDYEDVKGDSYYSLPKKEFDRFIDLADSSGFDVNYDESEKSVVFVYEAKINEGNWSVMMKGVKSGGSGPWSIVAIEYNKVVGQEINIQIRDLIPASYESMKRKFPKAKLHIEDAGGQTVFTDK